MALEGEGIRGLRELGLQLVLQQGGWDLQPVQPEWGIYSDCHSEEDGGFAAGVEGEGLSQHYKDAVRDAFYYQRLLSRERRPTSGNSMLTTMGGSIEVAWGGEEWVES